MPKYTKTSVTQLSANEQAALDQINKNFEDIQSAIADTVSRSAAIPSHMTADLDMNGFKIINAPTPTSDLDLVRRKDVVEDIATVQSLVNTTTNAAAQTLQAAQAVQEIISDFNITLVAEDLALGDDSNIKQVAGNKTNIDTVAGSISNVNTVGADIANVNTVASNTTNINTVAGISSDVTTVAGLSEDIPVVVSLKDDIPVVVQAAEDIDKVEDIAEDIIAVSAIASDVTTIASNSTDVSTVASISSDVSTVASNDSNVTTVAGVSSDVTTVAGISSNVTAVAGNSTNINAVASNETNINAVNANKTNIDAVAVNVTNINSVAGNSTNINAVAGNETNINSVAGNSTNINAVAGNATNINAVNSNKANIDTCANNISAITDAPTQANNAAASASAAAESAELSAQYANDKINQTHISNCITDIPQDIKLELNNGTLTLKAGSKVYVPNGSGVFNAVTISNDLTNTSTGSATNTQILIYNGSSITSYLLSEAYSGSSQPTVVNQYAIWYDTTNNKVKTTSDTGSTWQDTGRSLPIAIISKTSGVWTSIDQVFNGFGYIGSTIFALPNVKGLIPNGRNADGTLKNNSFTISSVITSTLNSAYEDAYIRDISFGWSYEYDEYRNVVHLATDKNALRLYAYLGKYKYENGKLAYFKPRIAFHALDWNDLKSGTNFRTVVETYKNGANWYRIWSDGWIEQGGRVNVAASDTRFQFLKPFSNANYTILASSDGNTNVVNINYNNDSTYDHAHFDMASYGTGNCRWYACGY